ncbi:hypothetical protein L1987_09248 [Smallanthus sonchifolius]|uniref:Uncharacterized protein n=1 Tax=Smallanthus sonchifolius TaxID=185202 RepID=A0ACB9JMG1_9ASTR|nr:hypothetical protein L1987_09248 [Smallanthus sonchifolius]
MQNISTSQPCHPTELLKVKKEAAEQSKASSPHQSPTRIELSTPYPQQTSSPMKDHSTPSPQRTITTPSSSRKKRIVIKKRKASITSWNHVGKRYVIKRDDNTREMFKCISDVMELSKSDLEKNVSLCIDRFNESESARLLIQALKKRGFSVREEEKKEEEPFETVPILDSLSSLESSEEEGDEEKEENFFGNEEESDSNDNNEIPADTEVPLTKSQVPIS